MQPRYRVSRAAIDLIKRFEGYRQKAAQLPDGRWVIGHGHTLTARRGAEVSRDDAEALLLYDLIAVAHGLNEQVFSPLSQNQFDALASFAFNIGLDNFSRSGVRRRLNEGAPLLAACAMELWRKAELGGHRIVVDALVRRRAAEKLLFLTPPGGLWVPAPSHVLKPLVDSDANDVVPRETPVEVTTGLDGEAIVVLREGQPAPPPVPPEEEDEGPARTAAEAVTARLSTIFQEPGEEPFALRPPEFEADPADEEPAEFETETQVEGASSPDLFDMPTPDAVAAEAQDATPEQPETPAEPEVEPARGAGPAWPGPPPEPEHRRIIDDTAPYEFEEAFVQPLPEQPEGGAFTIVMLAVLGLVFFGGGVFWALNARPMTSAAWLDPRAVGLFASVAGSLFFAVAVYLLLQRLARSSERDARHWR